MAQHKSSQLVKTVKRRFFIYSGISVLLISPFLIHKFLVKTNPELSRSLYFDKFFNNNKNIDHEGNKSTKRIINAGYLLKLYRILMKFNLVPKAKFSLENSESLKTEFLGANLKFPIGLAPGIDNIGNCISNLNELGFEYLEIGPLGDNQDQEWDFFPKINFSKDLNSNNIICSELETLYSVDYSINYMNKQIYNMVSQRKSIGNFYISSNLKLSAQSSISVPYMADTIFLNMLKSTMPLCDFATINFSSYPHTTKTLLQYKNSSKFETFLNKIKNMMHYEMGLKAVMEYEAINSSNNFSVLTSLKLNIPKILINKGRMKLLLRLDIDITNKELKELVDVIKKVDIIDGIIIGGMSRGDGDANFICGEMNREKSLKLLKECYSITKGEIPLISTGGILTGEDIYARLENGADLVLIYSPFLIHGPYCLEKLIPELEEKMKAEGKLSIREIKKLV